MTDRFKNRRLKGSATAEAQGFLERFFLLQAILQETGFEDIAQALTPPEPLDILRSSYFSANAEARNIRTQEEALRFLSRPEYRETAGRAAINLSIEHFAEEAVRNGMTYRMGAKGLKASDCSGFVASAFRRAAGGLSGLLSTYSEDQIRSVAAKTGFMLEGRGLDASRLQEGMIIGIDSGARGFDRGRKLGIDHVGLIYRDSETGKLMFAECQGGKGATIMPLERALERFERKNWKLFVTDPVRLAEDKTPVPRQDLFADTARELTSPVAHMPGLAPSAPIRPSAGA